MISHSMQFARSSQKEAAMHQAAARELLTSLRIYSIERATLQKQSLAREWRQMKRECAATRSATSYHVNAR